MKKLLSIVTIFALILFLFQINVYASSVPLGSVTVNLSKEKIAPGETVKVNIEFGTELGSYTFDVAYDKNIFEYVSSEGGTENDNGTRVRVTYYDSSGGSNPRTNMSITFKAKTDLVTTNLTDFSVTAEGLANSDASQSYDDISSPIKKSITVEPKYVDYSIKLNYSNTVLVNEEKEMELITESSLGKNYENVKMKVEVTKKPSDAATVKLLATERTRQEIDLIQEGWGEPDGYELGGKDVKQVLDIRGVFSEVGDYTIKVSLLDADSGNTQFATKSFNIAVKNKNTDNGNNNQNDNQNNTQNNEQNNNQTTSGTNNQNNTTDNTQKLPETLPKTGMTQYVYIITSIAILGSGYLALKNTKQDK